MKICFVVQTFDKRDRGGVLRVVSQLANLLIHSYEVEIIGFGEISENAYLLDPSIKLTALNLKKYNTSFYENYKKIAWFKEAYLKIQPHLNDEVIWITSSPPISLLFSYLKFKNKKMKVIGCDHTSTLYKKNILIQKVRNFMLANLDVVVALTPQDNEYYKKNGVNSVCIPNFIDISKIKKIYNKRKYLIYVGRFNDEKQPFKAVDLFVNSYFFGSNISLKMYGHGDYEEELQLYIQNKGYTDKVEIIKGQTDPDVIYKDAFALILTSKIEGFGLVLLEAMARNIPCLSFKTPYGPINLIKEGKNGFFIDEDVNTFNSTCKLIRDIDFSSISHTVDNYDVNEVSKLWFKLIDSLMVVTNEN